MGADVKQTGEAFGASAKYLRWQDRAANQKFFAGELAAVQKEAADLLLEVGIIKQMPDIDHALRHALHQVASSARADARAQSAGARCARRARIRARPGSADAAMPRRSSPSAKAPRSRSASPSSSLFVAAWAFATLGGFVSKTFLADPLTMLRDGWELLTQFGFAYDIGMTVWRVLGGFVIAAAVAVPLGIADGRLQAGRGVLRALRLVRPLPAGLGLHPAADPVGRHRRDAEARSSSSSARSSRSC